MRVVRLTISNCIGLENVSIAPGKVTRISGKNGEGKSSFTAALDGLVNGLKPKHIRKGAHKAAVSALFDDKTGFTRSITSDGDSKLKAWTPSTKDLPRAASELARRIDSNSLNFSKFLAAKEREQAEMFLEAVPMTCTLEELCSESGLPEDHVKEILKGRLKAHPLDPISAVYQKLYDARRLVNADVLSKTKSIQELEAKLPPPEKWDTGDFGALLDTLQENRRQKVQARDREIRELEAGRDRRIATAEADYNEGRLDAKSTRDDAVRSAQEKFDAAAQEARRIMEEEIAAARAKANKAISGADAELSKSKDSADEAFHNTDTTLRETRDTAITSARDACTRAMESTSNESDPLIEKLDAEVAEVRGSAKSAEVLNATLEIRDGFKDELAAIEEKAAKIEAGMLGLNSLKNRLMVGLKQVHKGLEFDNGELFLDGIPFSTLNTGKMIDLFLLMAKIRSKECGFVIIDGLEALDPDHYTDFEQQLLEMDIQAVVSKVSAGELTIVDVETGEVLARPNLQLDSEEDDDE